MPWPGQRLKANRYELLALLRRGGAGAVWRGIDLREGREVALKALPLEGGGQGAMEHEAEAALRVAHPHALAPTDTFVDAEHAWLAMELCAGSVADVLEEGGPWTPAEAIAALRGPLAALAAAHAAGVVHRDVKPSNLLVRGDGTVLLADFGIARMLADARAQTRSAALLGSLPYMAPEQRRDARDVRPATDVYATAATLATMLCGAPVGDLYMPGAALRLRAAGVPEPLQEVILRAGGWAPEERYPDAASLLAALESLALHGAGGAAPRNAPRVPTWVDAPAGAEGGAGAGGQASAPRAAGGALPPRADAVGVAGWVVATGVLALLAGAAAGAWVALRDDVRGVLVEEPEEVRLLAELSRLPVCDSPSGWTHTVAPRMEVHPDGLREATAYPLVADLDADGQQDVVYVHNASDAARIWWGDAGKLLDPMAPVDVPAARGRQQPVAGDFDGDGRLDVLYVAADGLWWLPQLAPRTFGAARAIEEVESVRAIAAGDVDRDGNTDLVMRFFNDTVWMRRGDGAGGLLPLEDLGFHAQAVIVGDSIGDAGGDLMTVEGHVLRVREGLPSGKLAPPRDLGRAPLGTVLSIGAHRTEAGGWIAAAGAVDAGAPDRATSVRVLRYDLDAATPSTSPCVLVEPFLLPGVIADVNGDDQPDLVGAATCGYCTSEYHAWGSR